jgi:hypothetical protein
MQRGNGGEYILRSDEKLEDRSLLVKYDAVPCLWNVPDFSACDIEFQPSLGFNRIDNSIHAADNRRHRPETKLTFKNH